MVVSMLMTCVAQAGYTIRYAKSTDLDAIMALDRAISWEHFKPLLLERNSDEKAVDCGLEEELIHDQSKFLKAINFQKDRRIKIACDDNVMVGFINFSKRANLLYIDLLMIDKKRRGRGIGKKLLHAAHNEFSGVNQMALLILKNNIAARAFYEKYGFVEKTMPGWGLSSDSDSYCYYVYPLV